MANEQRGALRKAFFDAHENAIELRRLLDGTRTTDAFIEVPRALLDKVTTEHSFMAGWCLSALPKGKQDDK